MDDFNEEDRKILDTTTIDMIAEMAVTVSDSGNDDLIRQWNKRVLRALEEALMEGNSTFIDNFFTRGQDILIAKL